MAPLAPADSTSTPLDPVETLCLVLGLEGTGQWLRATRPASCLVEAHQFATFPAETGRRVAPPGSAPHT